MRTIKEAISKYEGMEKNRKSEVLARVSEDEKRDQSLARARTPPRIALMQQLRGSGGKKRLGKKKKSTY